VTLLANPAFAELAIRRGLGFEPFGTAADLAAVADDPRNWDGREGFAAYARGAIFPAVRPVHDLVTRLTRPGGIVVANNYAYGASFAAAALGLPIAHVFIQPAMFRGAQGEPVASSDPRADWFPKAIRAGEDYIRQVLMTRLNAMRPDLDLRDLGARREAPEQWIALFPEWFAPRDVDWPANVVFSGFPLFDDQDTYATDPVLERFLAGGPPPVAVFVGSNVPHAHRFFAAALAACAAHGRRAIIVNQHPEQLPPTLPDGVLRVDYVPFGRLLPRSAAAIHHGGIGTIAQCLAAGLPQVAMPIGFEQPDNASYVARHGVGLVLDQVPDDPAPLAAALAEALSSPQIRSAVTRAATRLVSDNPFERAPDAILSLAKGGDAAAQRAGASAARPAP
jgi:UDP:flavonoid glycosyltransferase YjiC (YdhE family)